MRYFRLTALGKRLFGVKDGQDGRRMHWAQIPLDWFNDPAVVSLPDSQRLPFMGVGLLLVRRGLLPFDDDSPRILRRSVQLRTTPDLALYMDEGLIEFDSTGQQSHRLDKSREDKKREEEIETRAAVAPPPADSLPFDPPEETQTALGPEPPRAVALRADPLPWNREAAELWWQEYRGDPPKALFGALKPLVKRETWERVRPALIAYMAETPAEFVNIAGKFVAAFGTWEARSRGRPPTRSSEKARARDHSDSVMAMAGLKGGQRDRRIVAEGTRGTGLVPAGAGRDAGTEGDKGDGVPPGTRRAVG